MNRKGGPQRKTRGKLTKQAGERGKMRIKGFLQEFKINDRVQLLVNPSLQSGRYPLRFHGKIGYIKAKKGRSYQVSIRDQSKEKSFTVQPIHLKRL